MESILRRLSKCSGKSEEELRNEMREELLDLEAEVSALKELLKAPKAKTAPKKKSEAVVVEATGGSEGSEVEEKKAAKTAPKKKSEEATGGSAEKKAPKASPKKKSEVVAAESSGSTEAVVVEATEGSAEKKAAKKKTAPKKKSEGSEAVKEVAVVVVEEEVVEETEEEVEVEEIEYEGVKYLRSHKGIVYDMETSEEIGRWNETKGTIDAD